jgi:hypothetical protein
MFLADIHFTTEGIGIISTLITVLSGACYTVFHLLMKSKDDYADFLKSQIVGYQQMITELTTAAESDVNRKLSEKGLPTVKPLADVVPEHNSPTTDQARMVAEMQSHRARVTAITLAFGLPPRTESPKST